VELVVGMVSMVCVWGWGGVGVWVVRSMSMMVGVFGRVFEVGITVSQRSETLVHRLLDRNIVKLL
jgi:hypothetical protein